MFHFLLINTKKWYCWIICVCCVSCSVVSDSLQPRGLWPARFLCPWNFPGRITTVDCHFLLKGIFLTQRLNPGLLYCRQIFHHLSHQGRVGSYGNSIFKFWVTSTLFSIEVAWVYIPTNHAQVLTLFSTFSSAFIISCLYNEGHSNRHKVTSHCGFNLHFPSD